jgi:hypothetical protein
MMKIPLNHGTAITGFACLAAAGIVSVSLQDCASEPTPRCAVPPYGAVASYIGAGPPAPAPGAPAGTDCSTWVPPSLQGGCSGGCAAISDKGGGEFFNLETGYPQPNDPNWVHTPYSMVISNQFIQGRIQDYVANAAVWIDAGLLPGTWYPDYPYTSSPPPNPPDQPGETNRPYNWAPFDSVYPNSGICTVHFPESKMTYPDVPAHPVSGSSAACSTDLDCLEAGTAPCLGADPDSGTMGLCADQADQPETTISYKWSNVKVVADVANGNIGGQIFADLTITQDSCTQSFHVSMMSPQASCNATDDAGNNIGPDLTQCAPNPTNSDNYPTIGDASSMSAIYGSGIYPSVPIKCTELYPPAPDGGPPPSVDFECQPMRIQPTF